jgi:ligand-binding sensor domain-containing protein
MKRLVLALVIAAVPALAEDEWVSYADFRYVTSVAVGANEIAFGTSSGVVFLDRWNGRWLDPVTSADGLTDPRVQRIAPDADRDGWLVRTPSGNYELRRGEARPTTQRVDTLARDVLYPALREAAFGPPGIFVYSDHLSDAHGSVYRYSTLANDDWDRVWLGVSGLGPARYDPDMLRIELLPVGLCGEDVRVVVRDGDGRLWFAGADGRDPGFSIYDGDGRWEHVRESEVPEVSRLETYCGLAVGDDLWFGTADGLLRRSEGGGWRMYARRDGLPDGPITALCGDSVEMWVGSPNGLAKWNPAAELSEIVSFGGRTRVAITALYSDPTGVYLGTEIGAFRFASGDTIWRAFPDAPIGAEIVHAFDVYENEVWFGTDAAVWNVSLDDGSFRRYAVGSEFPGGTVVAISAGPQRVWVGGSDGVCYFSRRTDGWHRFGAADGLIDERVRAILIDGEYAWFGTAGGVSRLDLRRADLY